MNMTRENITATLNAAAAVAAAGQAANFNLGGFNALLCQFSFHLQESLLCRQSTETSATSADDTHSTDDGLLLSSDALFSQRPSQVLPSLPLSSVPSHPISFEPDDPVDSSFVDCGPGAHQPLRILLPLDDFE